MARAKPLGGGHSSRAFKMVFKGIRPRSAWPVISYRSGRNVLTAPSQIDPLLLPFLESAGDMEEVSLLTRLIHEHADPVIRQILSHKLQFYFSRNEMRSQNPDVEEIRSDIHLCLLKRLRELKGDPSARPVSNLRGYIAAIARNSCDGYLRRKYPGRRRLKDKVRYCLSSKSEFALWEDAEFGSVCGLAEWKSKGAAAFTHPGPRQADVTDDIYLRLRGIDPNRLDMRSLIMAVFEACGGPIELDHLTGLIAGLWGVEDGPAEPLDEYDGLLLPNVAGSYASPEAIVERHEILRKLWVEICQLSRAQRIALLLNLRSEHGVNIITLFPATGIATFEQIADALDLPNEQFEELWADLPMDDLSIAHYLGVTRQQVINLRRSARDRLLRRISAFQNRLR